MPAWLRWTLAVGIVALLTVVPFLHYRAVYAHGKRLRVVTPGRMYRSGQLTVEGFREALTRYRIRTVLNVQNEYPDPDIRASYWDARHVKESQLCAGLGVRYVFLSPDLIPRRLVPGERPRVIEDYLNLLDDPEAYPVLIHCKAGLHRTGVLVAVYRMEYEGWTPHAAQVELKANGFGEWACESANDYVKQYVLTYQRGLRRGLAVGAR